MPFPIIQVPTIKFLLPGKGTPNVVKDVVVVDPQAISIKVANADAAAKSIWLLAPKIVRKQALLLMRKVVQQRHRHYLKRLHLSVLRVVFAVHLLLRGYALLSKMALISFLITIRLSHPFRIWVALRNQHPLTLSLRGFRPILPFPLGRPIGSIEDQLIPRPLPRRTQLIEL